MASTRPEIADAVLDMVDSEFGEFHRFCEVKMGLSDADLSVIVQNITK